MSQFSYKMGDHFELLSTDINVRPVCQTLQSLVNNKSCLKRQFLADISKLSNDVPTLYLDMCP